MCGLIGWINKDTKKVDYSANEMVGDQFEEQKARGTNGFGIIEIYDNGEVGVHRAMFETRMQVQLALSDAKHILMHHRFNTSSDNMISQTHPMYVGNKELEHEYYVMHNGVISNAKELRVKHMMIGYKYLTDHDALEYKHSTTAINKFNDSEAFAIELARYLDRKSDVIASLGNQAFIAVQLKDGIVKKVIIGTNGGNPMILSEQEGNAFFASALSYDNNQVFTAGQATTFQALYDKKQNLTGFKEIKDVPELNFAVAPTYKQVFTTEKDPRDDDYSVSKMGFGTHYAPSTAVATIPKRGIDFMTVEDARVIMGEAGKGLSNADVMEAAIKFTNSQEKTKIAPPPADAPLSYARILHNLRSGKLGDVFDDKKGHKDHEFISSFNYDSFTKLFVGGQITQVEKEWTTWFESQCLTELDFGTTIEEALGYIPDFKNVKSLEEMEKRALKTVGNQMQYVASQIVPIFKLNAFMTAAIALGHSFTDNSMEKAKVEPDDDQLKRDAEEAVTRPVVSPAVSEEQRKQQHLEEWGQLHLISDCKQPDLHVVDGDLSETDKHHLMWGKHSLDECKMYQFHSANFELRKERHFKEFGANHTEEECKAEIYHQPYGGIGPIEAAAMTPTAKKLPVAAKENKIIPINSDPGEDADVALDVLGSSAEGMDCSEILSEAENVAMGIRTSASVGIESQLAKMAEIAAVDGLEVNIAKYEDKILDTVGKATKRFRQLASIVKAAKEIDEFTYGPEDDDDYPGSSFNPRLI